MNCTKDMQYRCIAPRAVGSPSFSDEAAIRSTYYAQSERLLKQWPGVKRVIIFDYTLRSGHDEETLLTKARTTAKARQGSSSPRRCARSRGPSDSVAGIPR
jgi:hypothetical protein